MADESLKAQILGGYAACVANALRSRRGDRSTFTRLAKGGPALFKFRAQASKMEGRAPRASRMALLCFGPSQSSALHGDPNGFPGRRGDRALAKW